MEILFGEVATALDLLPRKKVESFKRNMECIARVADKLFSQPQPGTLFMNDVLELVQFEEFFEALKRSMRSLKFILLLR
jgi:hypothetical protein